MCAKTVADNLSKILRIKESRNSLWDMVDKLLLEKISVAGISTGTEISEPWLQQYINRKYEHVPQQIDISKKGVLNGRMREMWSFVGLKRNKQWIWLAIDSDPERLSGCMLGVAIVPVSRHYGNLTTSLRKRRKRKNEPH